MNQLRATDVSYRGILHDVSLEVTPGRVIALLGPSGAGKSTLLSLLAGLASPDQGAVERSGRLGMVFQHGGLWDHLTIEQHLRIVGCPRPRQDVLLDQFDLHALRRRRAAALSGGERQRLAMARAIAARPDWLLLDEPLAHLDGPARAALLTILRDLLADTGQGVLIATHRWDEALRLASDAVVLISGRIAQTGPLREVYRQPASFAAAIATGPASLWHGQPVRPENVRFAPSPDGAAIVQHCDDLGATCELQVQHDADCVRIHHPGVLLPGTRGTIHARRPDHPESA